MLIENFKVGGLAKYNLDYNSLSQTHLHLIYCSMTGFGQTGPSASRAGEHTAEILHELDSGL